MNVSLGFTLIWKGSKDRYRTAKAARCIATSHFNNIKDRTIEVGNTVLELWGRGNIDNSLHYLPDGTLLALIGSPLGKFSWFEIEKKFRDNGGLEEFTLPWEGRCLLLSISPDGENWVLWNDWVGSIPVFHVELPEWRIASTLEPVVVSTTGFTSDDFFMPGLISLLIHGHYFSDWTLYKKMKVMRPDCVMKLDHGGCSWHRVSSVEPNDRRWLSGWDELVDEMHDLSRSAIVDVLETQPFWVLPLSSGLDSRLIAAVSVENGVNLNAYTWGPPMTQDVIYSRMIAKQLGIPWKNVDLGNNYLKNYIRLWADLFGSAMHFHGMYQIPFLEALQSEIFEPILSGFIGECLAGYDVKFSVELHSVSQNRQILPDGYTHWRVNEVQSLLRFPVKDVLDQIAAEIQSEINSIPGPWYQRLRLMIIWSRQRFFTYFQSMIADYWQGVATPYINRNYARFCFSLPRAVLDDRRLQKEMFRRYYPRIAEIPGTYSIDPMILTGRYLLKRRLASFLPALVSKYILREFSASRLNTADVRSLQSGEMSALWPIEEKRSQLEEWFNLDLLDEVYKTALLGDKKSVRKLQSVQTIAYRLLDKDGNGTLDASEDSNPEF
jgi:hypothetical protein